MTFDRTFSFLRGEEQNREEGEMMQKSREEGEIKAKKFREEGEIGSKSKEEGDLTPCPYSLFFLIQCNFYITLC